MAKNESNQFLINCSDGDRTTDASTGTNGSQKGRGLSYKALLFKSFLTGLTT